MLQSELEPVKRALKAVLLLERLFRPCGRWSSHVGKAQVTVALCTAEPP